MSILDDAKNDEAIDSKPSIMDPEMDITNATELPVVDNTAIEQNDTNAEPIVEDDNDLAASDKNSAVANINNALSLQRQKQLHDLTSKIDILRSKPHIVDITSVTKMAAQAHEIMGKRLELRQLQLRCEEINKEIEKVNQEANKKEIEKEQTSKSLGPVFGEVRLPKNGSSLSLPPKMSVVVPICEFANLQNVFGV